MQVFPDVRLAGRYFHDGGKEIGRQVCLFKHKQSSMYSTVLDVGGILLIGDQMRGGKQ